MAEIIEQVSAVGLVPVIANVKSVEDAASLSKALFDGGIPVAEVTFRMSKAEEIIAAMVKSKPDLLVGAGTVTTREQADLAISAGAKFLVSPALNETVIRHSQERGVPIIPGIATPSELDKAIGLGLDLVKFFPAEPNGGLVAIKAFCGPYKGVKFLPTGGISLENLAKYLAFDRIAACGGTFMLGNNLETGNWTGVTELCQQAVSVMLGLELVHVGVNSANADDAMASASQFADVFHFSKPKVGNSSIFVGTVMEYMKSPYLGKNGHIAFKTNSLDRAVNYLSFMGVRFNKDSEKRDSSGKLKAIYLQEEIAGFAIHLV
ncbi:MAG TPA: 2-dehydro-3-deoxyphosphogluconate aldolase [Anaerolineaceae bacterium]|jgi:2-dehydro-3-deoxyphosphogluconate aldolase/(4S)-4-hydroxy-2-oxoglutarate aldolase|nr:2-dehydro-3-deoxyphosphogluconate aldolase [Anaerolineaceae bacterium]